MTMNRVIHNAVRRDLAGLESALAAFPEGDGQRAVELQRGYGFLRSELTRHHEGEDTWIWPMLAAFQVDPALLAAMESEHRAMAEALATTGLALDALVKRPTAAVAKSARVSAVDTAEVVERHLAHEENDLEPELKPHVDSPEWHAVEKKLRSAPPTVAGRFFAWLQDGMDDDSRAFLRSTVPPPVTWVLSRLFGIGYYRHIAPVWRR
jgi:hemerythrin-like domain-containing protein